MATVGWAGPVPAGAGERPPGAGGAFVDSLGDPTAFATDGSSRPAGGGESGAAAGGASTVTCEWGVWIEDDDVFTLYDHEGGTQLHSGTGRWLRETCRDSATGAVTMRIVPEEGVDPVAVAQQALRSVDIPLPPIMTSPAADHGLYVQVPTWLWIEPGWWRAYTATATAGSVTATVEVVPVEARWDSGEGRSVTCRGAGRPWAPGLANETSDCSYTYISSSDVHQPDGRFLLRATVRLEVRWSASTGDTGSLPAITRSAEQLVDVGEIQAIETR